MWFDSQKGLKGKFYMAQIKSVCAMNVKIYVKGNKKQIQRQCLTVVDF